MLAKNKNLDVHTLNWHGLALLDLEFEMGIVVILVFFYQDHCVSSNPLNSLCPRKLTHSISGIKEGTRNQSDG